jgi:hypothetical protein
VIGAQGISTSYVSPTALSASIPASYLSAPGTLAIGVFNPAPGGGFSATTVNVTVGVVNPVPSLSSVSPTSVTAGSGDFTLTATGASFVSGAQIFWGATSLATTVLSASSASATVPASLVATAGSAAILIVNPTPGGGASSASTFTIEGAPPVCAPGSEVLPAGTFGCPVDGAGNGAADAQVFEVTVPTHFAMFHNHTINPDPTKTIQIRQGCGASSTLLEEEPYDCEETHARILQPGFSTFVRCSGRFSTSPTAVGAFVTEAVPPVGTPTVRTWDSTTVLTQTRFINASNATGSACSPARTRPPSSSTAARPSRTPRGAPASPETRAPTTSPA